jgi:6-phosphogluconolactonase
MKLYRLLILIGIMNANAQEHYNLIVGTYTNQCDSKGIYVYDFDTATAETKLKDNTKGVINPSYLTVSADNNFIYSVNEDGAQSTVSAFKYEPESGRLKLLNKKDAKGADPCHIISDDKNVIVANYSGGSIAVFGRNEDGSLKDAKQVVTHTGSSITGRQKSPHVHMVYFSPDGQYVLANDLGTDRVYVYQYNPDGGAQTLVLKQATDVRKGSGPRHLAFNPNGIFAYLLQELDATLTVFSYNEGSLTAIQETTVAPTDRVVQNGAADIHITKSGRFLYATNRGNANNITVFRVHSNGKLDMVQQISTMGEAPRNFTIDPTGNFVLVANQNSNAVVLFKRDKVTGMLEDTGKRIELCQPVCLVFTENKSFKEKK